MGGTEKSECWACAKVICDVSIPILSSLAPDLRVSRNVKYCETR